MDMGFNIADALNSPIVPPGGEYEDDAEDKMENAQPENPTVTDSVALVEILKTVTRIEAMLKAEHHQAQVPSQSPMLDATLFDFD